MAQVLQTITRGCIMVLPKKQEQNTPSYTFHLGLRNLRGQVESQVSFHMENDCNPQVRDRHGYG